MILVSKTYDIVTEESAEYGDIAESGFVFENSEYGFRELVRLMRNFPNPSCYPTMGEIHCWLSSDPSQDYFTGDVETESIHYSKDNPQRNAKYWRWAMRAVGVAR